MKNVKGCGKKRTCCLINNIGSLVLLTYFKNILKSVEQSECFIPLIYIQFFGECLFIVKQIIYILSNIVKSLLQIFTKVKVSLDLGININNTFYKYYITILNHKFSIKTSLLPHDQRNNPVRIITFIINTIYFFQFLT